MKPLFPKAPTKLLRIALWGVTFIIVLWVAYLVDIPKKNREIWSSEPTLKADIQKIWNIQTTKIDEINKRAEDFIKQNNLQVGDPLPPKTFFKEGDTLWEAFNKTERVQILGEFSIKAGELETKAYTLISVEKSVPAEKAPYAVGALIAAERLVPGGLRLYPQTPTSMAIFRTGILEIEEKGKKSGGIPYFSP